MKRKYTVRNVGDKLTAQRLNSLIAASRRVTLTADNSELLNEFKQTHSDFKSSSISDIVNGFIENYLFLIRREELERKESLPNEPF
jgi:hypothetical protein